MKHYLKLIIVSLLFSLNTKAQNWTLELKSYVSFRTWKLTTKAESKEIQLEGATIKLFQGAKLVSQITSDASGEFTLLVPPNAEFIGEVSYPGCNAKRFTISTTGVPEKVGTDDYKPTFTIKGGFVMVKPYPSIDYSGLQNSLIKVSYLPSLKNFDNEEAATQTGLGMVGKIYGDEDILFEKFCAKNRAGDAALKIPDCPLARKLYNEAIAIIPNEEYPVEQLKKVGACLKEIEEAEKKAKEAAEAKEKARLDKLAQDKTEAERITKENEAKEKANKEKIEKSAADKLATEKAAKEKSEADKIAKENAAKEKVTAKETENKKNAAEKLEAEKSAKEKTEADKLVKENAEKDKINSQKTEKEKAAADKIAKENAENEKTTIQKAEKEKAAAEKFEAEKSAKKKAEDDEKIKKEKTDEDEIAKKKKAGEKEEEILKGKQTGKTDEIIGGKQTGKTDVPIGGAKLSTPEDDEMDAIGNHHHNVRKLVGVDQYKAHITKANDYFKKKRYEEAKAAYEEALKDKADDVFAKNRISEIEKILSAK